MNESTGILTAMFFPKQLSEFQFFIRSITLGLFTFFSGLLLATMDIENRAVTLYGLLAIFLVVKAYHILCVIGPRFKDIGLEPGYAAFALIPFLGLVIFVGCCFAPRAGGSMPRDRSLLPCHASRGKDAGRVLNEEDRTCA